MFEIEWHGRRVALKASNGRFVCMKKNGQLAAISDFVGEHSLPVSWGSSPSRVCAPEVNLIHPGVIPGWLFLSCLWGTLGTSFTPSILVTNACFCGGASLLATAAH
jgi:hypothetical protein